jgi:hypothetical protein
MAMDKNNDSNPIVSLYGGLSPPCGDPSYAYGERKVIISNYYKTGWCDFDIDDSKFNSLYKETGLSGTEFDVYTDNDLISTLEIEVPYYNESELLLNSYFVY